MKWSYIDWHFLENNIMSFLSKSWIIMYTYIEESFCLLIAPFNSHQVMLTSIEIKKKIYCLLTFDHDSLVYIDISRIKKDFSMPFFSIKIPWRISASFISVFKLHYDSLIKYSTWSFFNWIRKRKKISGSFFYLVYTRQFRFLFLDRWL